MQSTKINKYVRCWSSVDEGGGGGCSRYLLELSSLMAWPGPWSRGQESLEMVCSGKAIMLSRCGTIAKSREGP